MPHRNHLENVHEEKPPYDRPANIQFSRTSDYKEAVDADEKCSGRKLDNTSNRRARAGKDRIDGPDNIIVYEEQHHEAQQIAAASSSGHATATAVMFRRTGGQTRAGRADMT